MKFEYSDGETVFEGYLVEPENPKGKRPCILVAHAWDGPNDHFNQQADEFTKQGYVAFAIDVYGKGVRGKIDGDNSHLMNPLLGNRALLRKRLLAALAVVQNYPTVIPDKIAIIGHCFGGLCALDLARAVPEGLAAAISVHAPLNPPDLGLQPSINASLLILHGWEDPIAKAADVLQFTKEMTSAGADWQIHAYGHAKHAFTFVGADIPELGIKYDPKAHRRSTVAIGNFLTEVFTQRL